MTRAAALRAILARRSSATSALRWDALSATRVSRPAAWTSLEGTPVGTPSRAAIRGFAAGARPQRPGPGPDGFDPDDLLAPLREKVERQMAGLTEQTPQQAALERELGSEDDELDERGGEQDDGGGTDLGGRSPRDTGTGSEGEDARTSDAGMTMWWRRGSATVEPHGADEGA